MATFQQGIVYIVYIGKDDELSMIQFPSDIDNSADKIILFCFISTFQVQNLFDTKILKNSFQMSDCMREELLE